MSRFSHWIRRLTAGGALLGAVLTLSCGFGNIPVRDYYTLNYSPMVNVPAFSLRPYPYAVQISRFEVRRIYNRQNIIYRFSANQVQFYEYENWAVRPDYMMRDLVFQHIEESRLFNRVSLDFLDSRPDFRIEGTVEALERFDAGDLFFGHLAMTFKMFDVSNGQQVWQYSFDQRRQVYSDEMIQTIRGISAIFQSQMEVMITQVDSLLYTRQTGKSPSPGLIARPPAEETPSEQPPVEAPAENEDLDNSEFEIIPEQR